MTERQPNPRAIDLSSFCRHGVALSGAWPLGGMSRLAESFSAVPDGDVAWSARGSLLPVAGGVPELWLDLNARAQVPLQCQRCLQTMSEPLSVERRIRFVRTEEEAARLDEESEEDVLVQPPRLDLQALLEDELILALPLVPRHAECPDPLPAAADAAGTAGTAGASDPGEEPEETPPHPFAALAALRKR